MDAFFQSVIDTMVANPGWAFWIALILAAAENTAFLSIFIHTTPVLIGVGAIASTGRFDFTPVFLGAGIGSVLGATLSWWLGIIYGERILQWKPLRARPELIARATAALNRWGAAGIVIGHFFFAIRPVIFLMCGMVRMNFWKFSFWNIIGSFAWAYLAPKLGQISGQVIGWLWTTLGL